MGGTVRTYKVSEFWEHLCIGQWVRILEQDRAEGTVTVREAWPDGQEWYITMKVIKRERIHEA